MLKNPKLSIVTPTYNSIKYIDETIKSVISQSYENWEYIIVDGLSNDGTVERLKEYEMQVKNLQKFRWISEKDNGQTDAINKGMRMCTGDWFAFINADDYYQPNIFAEIAPILKASSEIGVIYGNQIIKYEGQNDESFIVKIPPEDVNYNSQLYGNQIYGPASFYNMEAIKRVGEFDQTLYHWMDWDMYLRISRIMKLQYINKSISTFRIHADNKSPFIPVNRKAYKRFHDEAHRITLKYGGKYFSKKWLERYYFYGKFRFYLSIVKNEDSAIKYQMQSKYKVNEVFLLLVKLIYILKNIFKK